ncbi:AmmeMemoRadiSam system radical SAM enzyme [Candidatus Aerophobetes bacterium]|nr:AmmeMemoRadiSam system radical SAM enzyme [Candidatus Aerophobetes bacterium]
MKEAMFYEKLENKRVKCNLCPHQCLISNFKKGICRVRENKEGILYTLVYGKVVSYAIDPVEKKPLYHFYPGASIFSLATVGCNFRCLNCQNYSISQLPREQNEIEGENFSPEEIISLTEKSNCQGIAYTYTEPTIFFEYAYEICQLARKKEIKNIFVTNGFISEEALRKIIPFMDAVNVDLKSFSEEFYKKICGASLKPILNNLKIMKKRGVWIEVTTLIIPTLNDSEEELKKIAKFILSLGEEVPWHLSRFYPTYKLKDLPPTPLETLHRAREIGLKMGIRYVYTGNVPGDEGENTYCYNCKKLLIRRYGYRIENFNLRDGRCRYCGTKIDGVGMKR